jgi:chemotaxis protein MotB
MRENPDRWLVSYADFITLLFAFFVVMFATSQVNKKKVSRIAEVYSAHLKGERPVAYLPRPGDEPEEAAGVLAGNALASAEIEAIRKRIEKRLRGPINDEKISMSVQPRGLVLSLREAAFFDAGHETFQPGAVDLLGEIGRAIRDFPHQPIRLEGHTDNVPIQTAKFPSNWELSTARAVEVMKPLTRKFDLPAGRIAVAGYGEYHPLKSNATPEGREANRRVDVVILSQSAAAMAPRQRLEDVETARAPVREGASSSLPSTPEP